MAGDPGHPVFYQGPVEPGIVTLNSDLTVTGELEILPGATFVVDPAVTLTAEKDLSIY